MTFKTKTIIYNARHIDLLILVLLFEEYNYIPLNEIIHRRTIFLVTEND